MNRHPLLRRLGSLAVALGLTAGLALATGASADTNPTHRPAPRQKPTVVLVHGAFADASGWNDVTKRLQRDGYPVIAPANPLRSVDSDSAYIRSILETIDGPIVLVGHSYGGFVITNAAAGNPNVKALVYVAAFVPAAGETVGGLTAMNPGSGLNDPANLIVRPTPAGADGYINPVPFRDIFAGDLPRNVTAVMATSQRPADLGTLSQPSGEPAWQTIPSWYVVASNDRTIPPATQRYMAQRAGATTVEIKSSHVVMISNPKPVTNLIETAARGTT